MVGGVATSVGQMAPVTARTAPVDLAFAAFAIAIGEAGWAILEVPGLISSYPDEQPKVAWRVAVLVILFDVNPRVHHLSKEVPGIAERSSAIKKLI